MKAITGKFYPRSVKGKILAGFILAFGAIFLAFSISKLAFTDMLGKVEELSEPSGKLTLLNRVFQEVTTLDQLQRAQAIENPRMPHSAFLNQSQKTINLIDSISLLPWDSIQYQRIMWMKRILQRRDSVFFSYLKLKSRLVDNRALTRRIDTLSSILEKKKIEIDSSIVTTEKRTTTTYVKDTITPVKDERGFFGKIFGKKKKETETEPLQLQVEEEFQVVVDTLVIANQNKALDEVEKIMHALETDQRSQSKQLLERELQLINTNSLLINQLLGILREVEKEEFENMQQRSGEAGLVVSESIRRISLLLIAFFLGAALLVYLIWTDISKSKVYKEQLEKARDEAEELSQIKQRFLANMSHEIRTPLQSIIGFAEHLKHDQKNNGSEAVDAIHSSSEHLLHIVNEVLDYSRISSGNFTLAREEFSLMRVIREVESAMRIQADKKDLVLILDFEQASDFTLTGDSFRLRQILYNLLGNAIKFTTRGFVRLSVTTKTFPDNKVGCLFEIMDTGIGIRKEDVQKIFNQFEQADTSITRTFGGTGLGLTIVKSLVEAQGGKLTLDSEPGRGSTFMVSLTYDISVRKEVRSVEPAAAIADSPEIGTVLVVDDDPMILRLCGLILKKHQIIHVLYNNPEVVLNLSPDDQVSHILMDIRMPEINGVDLCRALSKKWPARTRLVALTAHVFEQEKKMLYEQGFHHVLSKPFHEDQLMNLLGVASGNGKVDTHPLPGEIDLEPLRKITLYDEQLLQSVVEQFREETTSELEALGEALHGADRKTIREIVHKLAGRVGQIGVLSLSLDLRDTELRIERGEVLESLIPQIQRQRSEVKKLVKELSELVLEKSGS